jgi:hypothetical protein
MSTLAATDDGSTGAVSLGFTITIGATDYSSVYINNNGNLTFNSSMSTFTPFGISTSAIPLLAPFFADVDTRGAGSGLVSYGSTQIDGRNALVINWDDVGYFNRKVNKLNDFQLVLIDRSDIAAGEFDFEFNYEAVEWETGDFSGGSNGLGGNSARVGFSNGVNNRIEFIGSGVHGGFLDSGVNTLSGHNFGSVVDGRFRFQVRDGEILSPVSLDNDSIAENSALGSTISTFSPFDPNTDNIYSYSLVSGAGGDDNASFTIVGDELRLNTALNFEQKSSYTIRVQAVNQYTVGFERILTVHVTDVNDAPTDISLSADTVVENSATGTSVGSFSATDPDSGNTFTYSLVSGTGDTDNASFTIVGNELRTNAAIDFDAQSSYSILVRVTDQGNLTYDEVFTVTATNVNEAPTDIGLSDNGVEENSPVATPVGTFSSTDPDSGNTFTYTLVSGTGDTDNASFTIVGNELRTNALLDFGTQSTYSVRVRSTDQGSLNFEKVFTITKANESPTDISLTGNSVAENSPVATPVGTFSSTDPDTGNTFTYTLVSGTGDTDNASFTIVGNELRTTGAFNYEVKNSYSIRVRTTDQGSLTFEKSFTVSVTNVAENPVVVAQNFLIGENSANHAYIGTIVGSDPDIGQSVTFAITAGNTGNAFAINATTGVFTVNNSSVLDWETVQQFNLTVSVTDNDNPALTASAPVIVYLANRNEAPVVSTANFSIDENSAVDTIVGTVIANDVDAGQTLTYSIAAGNQDEAFKINSSTGVISVKTTAGLDFEYNPDFSLVIRVVDNGNPAWAGSAVVAISVTNFNEAPVVFPSEFLIDEMSNNQAYIGHISAYDPDAGQTLTYSITGGNTGNAFAIDPATGILSVNNSAALDYETASQLNLTIQVADNANPALSNTAAAIVYLRDVNDAPTLDTSIFPRLPDLWRRSDTNPGITVADVIPNTLPENLISDQDAGALEGFAVINASNPNGTWQYSLDGGTTWNSLADASVANARLLDGTAKLQFVPTKKKFFGEVSLTIVAWDQTVGTNGGTADASLRGGRTAFSTNSSELRLTILKKLTEI